jgi:hypothetical protein
MTASARTQSRDVDAGAVEPGALDVVEEAVSLLKRAGPAAYGAYAAGTLGFLWALLYFWAYMSRNALAGARLSEFSLLLALAFAIMKLCHALFFRRLMQVLEDAEPESASFALMARTALAQCLVQPLSLFAIPIALLLALPYPFVSAFFQNALWVRDEDGFATWMGRSMRLSRLWPKQNMYIHLFLAGAGICLFLNVFSGLMTAPMLLKSLLGVETVFSRTPSAYLNSTFILMVFALTWALLDPVIKAINAWRAFHGLSLRTGLDLRLALKRLEPAPSRSTGGREGLNAGVAASVKLLVLGALIVGLSAANAWAEPGTHKTRTGMESKTRPESARTSKSKPAPPSAHTPGKAIAPIPKVVPDRLEALLKAEIAESRYGWRLPREAGKGDQESWVSLQLKKAYHSIRHFIHKVRSLWQRFEDWFNGLFNKDGSEDSQDHAHGSSPLPTRILVILLSALFLIGIAVFLLRRARAVPVPIATAAPAAPKVPDVSREDVKADDFPEEEWLRLMERLRTEGQGRLALRALFLAMLSLLARKGWITVARHKSNRDYQREVASKARRRPGVAESFRENCLRFDRVWYGLYEASGEDWEISQANFAKVRQSEA